ncbi:MAG: sigma-54-dependent transcriptional regulator [Myxococcota bacterium]
MSITGRILVVDDEPNLRKVLSAMLGQQGYEVLSAAHGGEAQALLAHQGVDVILTDLRMPETDGMELLAHTRRHYPRIPVVVLTAHGTVDTAVHAMKLGAFDYLTKPFDRKELETVIAKAAATSALAHQEADPAHSTVAAGRFGMIGSSEALHHVFRTIEKVANSPTTVLITGESGTGKELIASALHAHSSRIDKPFIKINCAAIPKELMESELFGHERGAFTGAVESRPGRFELAHEGTLFLDEIGVIPPEMQVKLLRVIQESEFQRVGGIASTHVDVRLVAATNVDLLAAVQSGRFREDLYYRLNVVSVKLPPLRERLDDIPLLVDHFLEKYRRRLGKEVDDVSTEAMQVLLRHDWPGNIRELENVMERAVLFSENGVITPDELPEGLREASLHDSGSFSSPSSSSVGPLKKIVRQHAESVEKELIVRALAETQGNVTQAARRLEISRKSLQNKMKEFHLRDPED